MTGRFLRAFGDALLLLVYAPVFLYAIWRLRDTNEWTRGQSLGSDGRWH